MAQELSHRGADFSGALLAWKRRGSQAGVVMTLQIVETDAADHRFHRVILALDDRQLRYMARDLLQIARERGMELPLRERAKRWLKSLIG